MELQYDAALRERLLDPQRDDADEEDAAADGLSASKPVAPPSPSRATMSAVERLMLSPYEKWVRFGRFPFKTALHVLLLALTFAQMALYDAQNAAYMRASHRNWAYFFLPPSADVGETPRFQRTLYTLNQTVDALFFLRDAYFSVEQAAVANYELPPSPALRLELLRRDGSTDRFDVTRDAASLGPFRRDLPPRQRQRLLQSLRRVAVSMALRDRQDGDWYSECFDWTVRVRLDVVARTHLKAQLDDCEIASCTRLPLWRALRRRFVWLHVVIAVVTAVYLALSGRALLRSYRIVSRAGELVKRAKEEAPPTADARPMDWTASSSASELPLAVRLKLFNGLQIMVFVALSLLLLSSLWSLVFLKAHVPISYWHRLVQATAMLLLWSSLVGYLEHNRQVYSIVLTLRWSAPRVLQFLVGVSPVFLGFALFGTIYFGPRVAAFGSLSASMMTLFAVLNGDVILDTFDALERHGFATSGTLYLYSFIALFIYVVLNIFIAIVEEAFFATRNCRRMLDLLLTDPKYAATNVGVEASAEVSAEMVRLLLQMLEESDGLQAAEEQQRTANATA
ncbi:hypothetical protein ATCC90586_003857 [Pythium insidiosum]|nr:hypothetical protein ATCC90586_003857 [Pythium insidiosum]